MIISHLSLKTSNLTSLDKRILLILRKLWMPKLTITKSNQLRPKQLIALSISTTRKMTIDLRAAQSITWVSATMRSLSMTALARNAESLHNQWILTRCQTAVPIQGAAIWRLKSKKSQTIVIVAFKRSSLMNPRQVACMKQNRRQAASLISTRLT